MTPDQSQPQPPPTATMSTGFAELDREVEARLPRDRRYTPGGNNRRLARQIRLEIQHERNA